MKTFLLLSLALSLTLNATCQDIPAPTPRAGSTVCLPETKARLIVAELQRLPLVLAENHELRKANAARRAEAGHLREALTAKDTVIVATERRLLVAKVLGRDAENRAGRWERKAKNRFWALIGETALLVGTIFFAAGR